MAGRDPVHNVVEGGDGAVLVLRIVVPIPQGEDLPITGHPVEGSGKDLEAPLLQGGSGVLDGLGSVGATAEAFKSVRPQAPSA